MAAERETVDRLIASHLATQTGAVFHGRIGGVVSAGLVRETRPVRAPTASFRSPLSGTGYFAYDQTRHALIGERSGETYQLGDRLEVRLVEATPVSGGMRFEVVSGGREGLACADRRVTGCRARRRGRATAGDCCGRRSRGSEGLAEHHRLILPKLVAWRDRWPTGRSWRRPCGVGARRRCPVACSGPILRNCRVDLHRTVTAARTTALPPRRRCAALFHHLHRRPPRHPRYRWEWA